VDSEPLRGIDDPGAVDLVRVPAAGPAELVLFVDRWDGSDHRQLLLQEKLNRYLEHVLDGELVLAHPEATGRPWLVVVESAVAPDARTAAYLQQADGELRRLGGGVELRQVQTPGE
jgi:hypothetical protein